LPQNTGVPVPTLAVAALVSLSLQAVPDRQQAEQLARSGRAAEALAVFEQIVARDPGDTDARLWVARLQQRLGRSADAEAIFRDVLRDHPADVDARIGLGTALLRKGAVEEAIVLLRNTERDAGQNADLFATLGRAYRRSGHDRLSLDYFTRAKRLSPSDPDVVEGYESAARAYGHALRFEGYVEPGTAGENPTSGLIAARLRVHPSVHVDAIGRVQRRGGSTDALAGAGVLWDSGRATNIELVALGGADNVSLPASDIYVDVVHYKGQFEIGAGVRRMAFEGSDIVAVSPALAWDTGGLLRLFTRYTLSRSDFEATDATAADHSALVRTTWRTWRRVWLDASYAYGIESFEQLTADRIGSLGGSTVAGGVRVALPSLTLFTTSWEHTWRSNHATSIDRVTVSVLQSFP
jgi:hypothetical protein